MDLAMIGEGELAFVDLTNALINNEDINDIAGLVKKIGPKKYIINKKHRTTDLAELPRPARHLVDMEGYFKIGAFQGGKPKSPRVLSIMCSRGCPEKCTFCTTPQMWGSNIRWRPVEKIMEEINEDVKKYNIGEIPIKLPTRSMGSSKMRFKDITNGFIYLLIIFIKYRIKFSKNLT